MTQIIPGSTIGIIGGGQLGRMIAIAAAQLGYKTHIYTDQKNSPASCVSNNTFVASYDDEKTLKEFASTIDIATFEFENVPNMSVQLIGESVQVRPNWQCLHITQNRKREKDFLNRIGVATAPYKYVENLSDVQNFRNEIESSCILKTTEMGYDGKGQQLINAADDLELMWQNSGIKNGILEQKINFNKEISIIIARSVDKQLATYVAVENIHNNGILQKTIAPAEISQSLAQEAESIAIKIVNELDLIGILAVEMFVTDDDKILVNELAPRPHNSGHWTMDACVTSQFEQLVRAICGLPLGNTEHYTQAVMTNLIGDEVNNWPQLISDPHTKLHLYGKKEIKPGRKMGHHTKINNIQKVNNSN